MNKHKEAVSEIKAQTANNNFRLSYLSTTLKAIIFHKLSQSELDMVEHYLWRYCSEGGEYSHQIEEFKNN